MPVATSSMRWHRCERTIPDQCYREISLPFVRAISVPGSRVIVDRACCAWLRRWHSCRRHLSLSTTRARKCGCARYPRAGKPRNLVAKRHNVAAALVGAGREIVRPRAGLRVGCAVRLSAKNDVGQRRMHRIRAFRPPAKARRCIIVCRNCTTQRPDCSCSPHLNPRSS